MTVRPTLTYVVGDIHGRYDLLCQAVERINQHAGGRSGRVVFLGDYVDRGPQSSKVIDSLMVAQRLSAAVCLKGNHEDMMLRAFLGDADEAIYWIHAGGEATLRSYGSQSGLMAAMHLVPPTHLDWLRALPTILEDEHRIYVHAGLDPSKPADDQDEHTLLWIRERFLRADPADFAGRKHIVHGHTPEWEGKREAAEPELLAHRTNLDTGAFWTGVLTVGVFDALQPGGPVDVLRVCDPSSTGAR
ncbi:metallophosphoesterase family protein [Caulobacter sp. S45]|uniref:metallophosphoesterase family protein n=1 Tax=Caulobacter sp. S45 TaxID=1641861 RepID=UPI00131D89B1|nr:metallophosphoesterase family protein [Caulobacter sp. S45]